jgi:membrane dipeptidase
MLGRGPIVSDEVAAYHEQALVIDLHNDLLTKLTHSTYDITKRHAAAALWNPLRLDLDIPRIRAGGLDALGCLMFGGFRVDGPRRFWRQLARAQQLAAAHAQDLAFLGAGADWRASLRAGKIGLFLGVEGSYAIDGSDRELEEGVARLADGGVRFLGPLWERANACGSSCRSKNDEGLTERGRRLVAACNEHGLLLDVAHASPRSVDEMCDLSRTPPFSSHSGARAVHEHPRNLSDEQIRRLAARGGIVGVIFVSTYVGGTFCSLERIADHIEHVAAVGGEDCVALGSDFDGFMPLPRGLRDVADLPRLTQVLWDRGWRPPRLDKLLGENALRFFAGWDKKRPHA